MDGVSWIAKIDVSGLLEDGALMKEVRAVLERYLSDSRDVWIGCNEGECMVTREGLTLHKSASYTACLEYALALPVKEAKP